VSGITGGILSYSAAAANATVATVMVQSSAPEAVGVIDHMHSIGVIELSVGLVALAGGLIRIAFDVIGFRSKRRKLKH
jgi:hypothetical protein